MAHYPIKCVRCAHIATNNTVLFNIRNTVELMSGILANQNNTFSVGGITQTAQNEGASASGNNEETGKFWENSDEDTNSSADFVQQESVTAGDLMTYPAMQQYCIQEGLGEVIPRFQHIEVTPDFAGKDIDDPADDLLVGMEFRTEKRGTWRRANKRYCPRCHCELPASSGRMPTYNITVMGTSSSGKTVYLCALNWLLSRGSGRLPYSSSLSCVPASRNGNTITDLSRELFENGILPGTTQLLLTEPLVFQLTYTLAGKTKSCLLALADMRGEDLVSDDGSNLIARGEFFASADGFMLIVSPLNIPSISYRAGGGDGAETSATVHTALMQNINDYIIPFLPNGRIAVPSVIMLSKCDVLIRNAGYYDIPAWNPVVAREPGLLYTGTYFQNHYKGTREIVARDGALYSFLSNTMNDPYFTSFSSLGASVNVGNENDGTKKVANNNALNPLRVVDPVLYLLIRLGFLPAFHLMEAGAAYEKRNDEILSKWIQTHT